MQEVTGSIPVVPTTSERTMLRSDFCLHKNQAHAPSFLLIRKKARLARLFACKRAHDGSLALPPFCEVASAAQIAILFTLPTSEQSELCSGFRVSTFT